MKSKNPLISWLGILALGAAALLIGWCGEGHAGAIKTVEWVADDGSAARIIEFIDITDDLECDFATYTVIQNSIVTHHEQLTCEEAKNKAITWMESYGKTGFIPADEF